MVNVNDSIDPRGLVARLVVFITTTAVWNAETASTHLPLLLELSGALFALLLLRLALLEQCLGDENVVLGGDSPVMSSRVSSESSAATGAHQ